MVTILKRGAIHLASDARDEGKQTIGAKSQPVVLSSRYGVTLEVREQVHPVMGWVLVAHRKGDRFTQQAGVFTSQAFAEARSRHFVSLWERRFGTRAKRQGAIGFDAARIGG